jgi:HEAT repeat protein
MRAAQQAEIERHRTQVSAGAARFLDRSNPVNERLSAVEDSPGFIEPEQVASAILIVTDPNQPAAIRIRALQLVGDRLQSDTSFTRQVAAIVMSSGASEPLRSEAVLQLAHSSFDIHHRPVEHVEALRIGARDRDLRVRRAAIRALAGHGDEVVLQMLAAELDSAPGTSLPPSETASLLGLKDPAPFYPLLSRLLRQAPDSATRLVAIRLLAGHQPSRGAITRILRDRRESDSARHAALGAVAAGDPKELPMLLVPVVADEGEPVDLRVRAIKAVEISRTSRDPKVFTRSPDDFDTLMERLAATSPNAAIQQSSRAFLARTRSPR